ncbi:MAG: hypothetical protein Q7R48_03815 [bacterium]|nr:hypothetical protein [bacterium]
MSEHESVPNQNDESTESQIECPEGFLDPAVEEYHKGLKHEINTVDSEAGSVAEQLRIESRIGDASIEGLKVLKREVLMALDSVFDQKILEIEKLKRRLVGELDAKNDLGDELRSESRIAE